MTTKKLSLEINNCKRDLKAVKETAKNNSPALN